jgi:hypothetical protein
MSAQGGTLGTGRAIQLPLWPVAVVVVAAVAVAIGMTVFTGGQPGTREQGGAIPASVRPLNTGGLESASLWTGSQAEAYVDGLAARAAMLENSSAAIRERGGTIPAVWGVSHVTPRAATFAGLENPSSYVQARESFAGFENPGAYITRTTQPMGLENPGAYGTGAAAPHESIVVNGEICGQCR